MTPRFGHGFGISPWLIRAIDSKRVTLISPNVIGSLRFLTGITQRMRNVPLGGNGTLRISALHDAAGTILSDDGAACLLSWIGKATRCSSGYAGVKSSAKKRDVRAVS